MNILSRKGTSAAAAYRAASLQRARIRVLLLWLGIAGFCGFLDRSDIGWGFAWLEGQFYDVASATHARTNQFEGGEGIVVLAIADETFSPDNEFALPGPPIPRNYHAKLIRTLADGGARVIAFDLLFDTPQPQDKELISAIREAEKSGTHVIFACGREENGHFILPNALLRDSGILQAHILVKVDEGRNVVRRVFASIEGPKKELIPAFSLRVALLAKGVTEFAPKRRTGHWEIGRLTLPVDKENTFPISYEKEAAKVFTVRRYENVLEAAGNATFMQKFFKDKIILVGNTTELAHDVLPTPLGTIPGIEIHAHAVSTLLRQQFLFPVPQWVNFAATMLLPLPIVFLHNARRLQVLVILALILLFGYFLVAMWLFVERDIALHFMGPLASLMLVSTAVLIEGGLREEREKSRMRALFERSVSPQIAEHIVNNPDKCIDGERVVATVLFSDIRGFTPLTEQLGPEELIRRLNEYFQAMTDVVDKHGGATARFIGDAMMAFFGAPVPYEDHARRAVAAAIDMQEELLKLQEAWCSRNELCFDIGIGINTGEMVAGIVGAQNRSDFTVHGNDVNLAARIEDLNKEYETRILISAATYEQVKDSVEVGGVWKRHVKGVSEETCIYEVRGWKQKLPQSVTEVPASDEASPLSKVVRV